MQHRPQPSQLSLLEALVNRPHVLASVAPGFDGLDMSAFFESPFNICLGDAHGMALFVHIGDGVYEGHYVLPDLPGILRMRRARVYLRRMFTTHRAKAIVGVVPVDNSPARTVTRALGFTPTGTSVSASGRSCVDYVLERATWVISQPVGSAE